MLATKMRSSRVTVGPRLSLGKCDVAGLILSEIPMFRDILNFAGNHPFVFVISLLIVCCMIGDLFNALSRLLK